MLSPVDMMKSHAYSSHHSPMACDWWMVARSPPMTAHLGHVCLLVVAGPPVTHRDEAHLQYSTLQYTTVHYSILQYTTVHYSTLQYTTIHYTALQ